MIKLSYPQLPSLLVLMLFLLSFLSSAQTPTYKLESGISAQHELSEKSTLIFGLFSRETFNEYATEKINPYTDRLDVSGFYQHSINDKMNVTLGFIHRSNLPFENNRFTENRFTQSITYKSGFLLSLSHRLRAEERIFKKQTDLRLRYQIKHKGAFKAEEIVENSFYYFLSEEILFNISKTTLAENRASLGLGYMFYNASSLEVSVSNRYSNLLADKSQSTMQLIATYSFYF